MEELRIREAGPQDDEVVGEILVRAFLEQYARKHPEIVLPEERLRELRATAEKRRVAKVLVAEREGCVVGTVTLYPPGAPGSEAWLPNAANLRQLAIEPTLHGKGLSAPILDAAEALCWSWGVEAICLHTRRGVTGVAEIYRRRGYVRAHEGDIPVHNTFLEAHVLRRPAALRKG